MRLDAKIPAGPLPQKWDRHRFELKLVNPANKRKYDIIVVGTGLAGRVGRGDPGRARATTSRASASRTRPRRAHSIAAQGGINAAKNYPNDGDSIWRLFYDTVKGGDFRAREANVYRLAQVSNTIIDQCVAQGVPFAREYGGLLANRSFGGAQVSRTFYARGQTGQQLLLGAYSALMRQVRDRRQGAAVPAPRNARPRGRQRPGARDHRPQPGHRRDRTPRRRTRSSCARAATATSTSCPPTPRAATSPRPGAPTSAGRVFANPCFTQIHPTCIPVHGDLPVQAHAHEREPAQRRPGLGAEDPGRQATRQPDPRGERDYFLERKYPSFGNLVPRDVASRNAKELCDEGKGVGDDRAGRLPRLRRRHRARRREPSSRRSTATSSRCTRRSPARIPTRRPMMIYPAVHYTMGGLWVDYNLMSTVPGLFVLGEANFSDHGANRLGASALMQGLADGYFVIPYTIGGYLAGSPLRRRDGTAIPRSPTRSGRRRTRRRAPGVGPRQAHRRQTSTASSGSSCGTTAAWPAPTPACRRRAGWCRSSARSSGGTCSSPGAAQSYNQSLEKAGRVADFLEFAELMILRCARAPGVLRRALPRGLPDRGERGPARRRQLLPRGRLGVHRRGQGRRTCTTSPWCSRTSISLKGATSEQDHPPDAEDLAAERARRQGPLRELRGPGHLHRHVLPRDAGRGERAADAGGQGADRLRARLPRGHLRHLRRGGQRPGARSHARRPRSVSSTCATSRTGTPW